MEMLQWQKILIDFVYLQILESRQVYEILAGGISARRLKDYLKLYDRRTQASMMKIYKENKGSTSKDLLLARLLSSSLPPQFLFS